MKSEVQVAASGGAPARHRPGGPVVGRRGATLSAVALAGVAAATTLGVWPAIGGGDLHAAMGIVAAVLAAAAHIRWGGGRDLLATLLLAVGALMGMGVTGGLVSRGVHGAAALIAALVSMEVHGEHLWQRVRS